MAIAAGAALLRSVATKMARAPPRLSTSSGGTCLTRFSTSTGSSANPRGPQTHNKKVPSGTEWHRAIVAFKEAASFAAFFLVFGSFAYTYFIVNPALDRIHASMEAERVAWVTMREELKKSNERRRAIFFPNKESQIEATEVSEGQMITGIGKPATNT